MFMQEKKSTMITLRVLELKPIPTNLIQNKLLFYWQSNFDI
jgi:hypothetical protein